MNEEIIKKDYEVSFLLKSPEGQSEVDKILSTRQAEILYRSELKEIKLAYPIKKQKSAYFGFYQFKVSPAAVEEITKKLFLTDGILRFLMIKSPTFTLKNQSVDYQRDSGKLDSALEVPLPRVLSNEKLEEKLEEILK